MRFALWIGILAALGLGFWALSNAFPGSFDNDYNTAWFIRLSIVLVLVSVGIVQMRNVRLGETLRNIALWTGIIAVLAVGYAFRDELGFVWNRVRGELVPGYGVETQPGELVLSAGNDGHFHVIGTVNGVQVNFLVDTGASDTVLSPADAQRTGYDLASLDYSRVYSTANGSVTGAPITLDTLQIGSLVLHDFPASVNAADLDSSLLGMSFLRALQSFEVRGGQLYLRW